MKKKDFDGKFYSGNLICYTKTWLIQITIFKFYTYFVFSKIFDPYTNDYNLFLFNLSARLVWIWNGLKHPTNNKTDK